LLISRSLGSGRVMMCRSAMVVRSLWSAQIMAPARRVNSVPLSFDLPRRIG
jgi:hypothetical protein